MSNFIGIGLLVAVLLTVVFLLAWELKKAKQKAATRRAQQEEDRKQRKLLDRRRNVGNRIFNAFSEEAAKERSGNLRVERIVENATLGYSVIVGWKDDASITMGGLKYRGYPIMQVDVIMVPDGCIHVFLGPYGPDRTWFERTDQQLDFLIGQLLKHLQKYDRRKQPA